MTQPTPDNIMQIGMGFMASKTLLTAIEFELFTRLAAAPKTAATLKAELGINALHERDFLDALVSLGFLERDGDGPDADYANAPDADMFLDKNKPSYIGGMLEMAGHRLYPFWNDLKEGLITGEPQNEVKHTGQSPFEAIYSSEESVEQFLNAMAGVQKGNFMVLLEKFDFSKYDKIADVGGASGLFCILAAQKYANLSCVSFDLEAVKPVAQRKVNQAGLEDRVTVVAGDFFAEALPKADVILMGNILHDWNLENKTHLIRRAYEALPEGGAFIAIENVIDDARRENTFGLLMSLNMLIELGDGFDYSGADFDQWCRSAGFKSTEIIPLAGPSSAAVAYK